ncbi:MAG: PQQ-dependent sugar dehydrogenase [Gemmatimonadota bacterium]
MSIESCAGALRVLPALLLAVSACADQLPPTATASDLSALEREESKPRPTAVSCDANNAFLELPPRFCALEVARHIGIARHITVRPNGDIYVAVYGARDGSGNGGIVALRDTDGDGKADVIRKFGSASGNGIVYRNEQLWFAQHDRIVRYSLNPGELVPSGAPVTVVSGLTAGGDHFSKSIAINNNGRMFVNIGSASNSCQVVNRADGSPGVDPCPELRTRAGIWRFSSTRENQTQTLEERFATELRNMVAIAINPADGALYGVQNGRDQLLDNWSSLFTARDDALLPAEELFRIERGKSYGWPYCFYDGEQNRKVLAPEYGGDGNTVGRCSNREMPLADYPAHWAPLSMLFYTGTQFPAQYRGGLFIAWHGSRFDPTLQPAGAGYNVTFTSMSGGRPSSNYSIFADGFAGGNFSPTTEHRPVGLAQGPDGSLYVTDDRNGVVYRILYR